MPGHPDQSVVEDEFLSEADLVTAEPAAYQGQQGHLRANRLTYGAIAAGVVMAGIVGFVVVDFAHPPAGTLVPAQNTPMPVTATEPVPLATPVSDPDATPVLREPPRAGETGQSFASSASTPAGASSLSGWWSVTNRVESMAQAPSSFGALNLGYRIRLTQNGNQITGAGHKWMENGRPVSLSEQTAVVVAGTFDGRQVTLQLTEPGVPQTSTTTFTWELTAAGTLEGTFVDTRADATGGTRARRMSPTS